jgi:hypothetical protein
MLPAVTPSATTGTIPLDVSKGCGVSVAPMNGNVTLTVTNLRHCGGQDFLVLYDPGHDGPFLSAESEGSIPAPGEPRSWSYNNNNETAVYDLCKPPYRGKPPHQMPDKNH